MESHSTRSIIGARSLGVSVLLALGLAMPLACGGGGSSSGASGSNGGAAGMGGSAAGGSAAGGSAAGGSAAGGAGGSATGGAGGSAAGGSGVGGATDAGPDSSVADASTDACQPTNGGVEKCDGIDNDCNGKTDDHVAVADAGAGVYTGDSCGCGRVWACPFLAGPNAVPSCQGDAGVTKEICNGIDDDCNGKIDDGVPDQPCGQQSGLVYQSTEPSSRCKLGTKSCTGGPGGTWSACTGYVGPTTETCDGKDDNCDGQVDNIAATCTGCLNGALTTIPEQCVNGTPTCVGLSKPLHWYRDKDGDGYPQPNSNWKLSNGNAPYGAVIQSGIPTGTSCQSPDGSTTGWISTTYDWSQASQRSADPSFKGIDCCDTEARAYPGEPNYYQAPTDKQIPTECTGQGVKPWDFDCNLTYSHLAPDPNTPSTTWNQTCDCITGPFSGWDKAPAYGGAKNCGDTTGNWIKKCGEPHSQDITGKSPYCK